MKSSKIFSILLMAYFVTLVASNGKQNFCQNDRCLTCIGRYCTTTCQGEYCKSCPLGDCCDGSNCNICRGEKCCSSPECNDCVIKCLKQCQGTATCHYDCFQQCLPNEHNGDGDNQNGNQHHGYGPSLISNKNYLPVNVTTIINITNTIENENVFHNPILINTTNVNNYTGRRHYHRKQVFIATDLGDNKNSSTNNQKSDCCEVVHPERCQKVQTQTEQLCYTRKHEECSELCSGKHVHIVEDKEQKHHCILITKEPHWYCGNYAVENCDACYECDDIDDAECTQSPNCSDKCRSSIISEDFYNKLYRKE